MEEVKKSNITRYYLYNIVYEFFSEKIHNKYDRINNRELYYNLANHFYISKELIRDIEDENNIDSDNYNVAEMLESSFKRIREEYINDSNINIYNIYRYKLFLNKVNSNIKREKSNKNVLREVIKIMADIHNDIFTKEFIENIRYEDKNLYETTNINRVFLSYAYTDKGLSYALYLYFKKNNSFLYVDWMWNDKELDCAKLKVKLLNEINKSQQFLLLRTPNSEYSTPGSNQIRQWCSWECGIGFSKIPTEKYMLVFYSKAKSNSFIDDIKLMIDVDRYTGKIY